MLPEHPFIKMNILFSLHAAVTFIIVGWTCAAEDERLSDRCCLRSLCIALLSWLHGWIQGRSPPARGVLGLPINHPEVFVTSRLRKGNFSLFCTCK